MKMFELLGHHTHPQHLGSKPSSDQMNVVVDKIQSVKNGHTKGVIVYGYMSGCPHCIRYDDTWSEACKDCPKGVFTYKIMMEDFPEDDPRVGTPPRSFPTIYSYTRSPDGNVLRKDHSQSRDEIRTIMEGISATGGASIQGDDGEEELLEDEETPYRAISTPTRFPTPPLTMSKPKSRTHIKRKTPKKKNSKRKTPKRKTAKGNTVKRKTAKGNTARGKTAKGKKTKRKSSRK